MRRALLLLLLLGVVPPLAAACAGGGGEAKAHLWVTRDRGSRVLVETTVPAGLTAIQALERKADVETTYGGRFVESIDGVTGNAGEHRDWFYFVNGIEADRGAAEYRLRPGDVLWWDYRPWSGASMRSPVVVGAFPEPFWHGYAGHVRRAVVRYQGEKAHAAALGLANTIRARSVEPIGVPVSPSANLLVVYEDGVPFSARLRDGGGAAGAPVEFRISIPDAKRVLRDPAVARFRYQGLP